MARKSKQASLFAAAPALGPGERLAVVALENALDKSLTYIVPRAFAPMIAVGQRVRVPLGRANKPVHGYVVELPAELDLSEGAVAVDKLKRVLGIDDERVLVTPALLELARWMSRYYVCPLGTVLETVIPSPVKKRVGLGYLSMARCTVDPVRLQELVESTKQPKRRALYARLLQLAPGEEIELMKLATEAGVKVATARKLAGSGVIAVRSVPDLTGLLTASSPSPQPHQLPPHAAPEPAPKPAPQPASPAAADAQSPVAPAGPGPLAFPAPTPLAAGEPAGTSADLPLNDDQRQAFSALEPKLAGGFSTTLLYGVTGSGKTEIYLQSVRRVVAQGKRALLLVPEIALTPQTVRRFMDRFPPPLHVAYLHSGLSATARHRQWHAVLSGAAQIVVGARSAIFAPLSDLGLIVVDEEHESSYKSDNAPRYNARDLAIKRGQLEGCPVLLASATPSLESTWRAVRDAVPRAAGNAPLGNAPLGNGSADAVPAERDLRAAITTPSPHLLVLPRRVRGLAMPAVELVDMKEELRQRRHPHLFSARLEHLLKATLDRGEQAIILLNRRGYSNFVYCASCKEPLHCRFCDVTLTYHRNAPPDPSSASSTTPAGAAHATHPSAAVLGASHKANLHAGQLHCHYCLAVQPLPTTCPTCGKLLSLFGLGTQKVEEELLRRLPGVRYARVDSDTMRSAKDYEQTLDRFGKGDIQVMLGTQMIAKGLDYPNVTLVGVISADTALSLPDFRSGERTFQLITQVAGRAGRGDAPGRVVLQTFLPDDPIINLALKQDYPGFAASELAQRAPFALPPFGRQARVVMRDTELEPLEKDLADLANRLQDLSAELGLTRADADGNPALRLMGPMPCPINRIAGYHRAQITLSAASAIPIQRLLSEARDAGLFKSPDRLTVDIDPVGMM